MQASVKGAPKRRQGEEFHIVRDDGSQVTVPVLKKSQTQKTVAKIQHDGDMGDSKIKIGHPGPKSSAKNKVKGGTRRLVYVEPDEAEEVRAHPDGVEDQGDVSNEEEDPPKKIRRVARRAFSPSDDESGPQEEPQSPPLLTAKQKQKQKVAQDQPPAPRTAPAQQLSSRSTERPGPSARAHRTKHQPRTASSSKDQHRVTERRRGESDTSRPERMAVNDRWTHIAKEYGMQRTPWVSEPVLDRALRYTMGQNPQGDSRAAELGRFLDDLEVDDNVRKDKQFRANFLLGLRELKSEVVNSLSKVAMEILGFNETPEHNFRDQTFDKSADAGFLDLLEDNKFLGTGDNYLCSDPIIKAIRVVLRGPSSIQTLQNPSRSRINRFGFKTVPPALVALVATVIYFILCGSGSFEYNPEGDEEYEGFFLDRCDDLLSLGHKSLTRLFGRLNEEVFGIKRKEATAEQRRQREFSRRRLQEIRAQAAIEDMEEGGADSQRGEDNQPSGSGQQSVGD